MIGLIGCRFRFNGFVVRGIILKVSYIDWFVNIFVIYVGVNRSYGFRILFPKFKSRGSPLFR